MGEKLTEAQSYHCPVCNTSDPTFWQQCDWGGCPDGRDPRPTPAGAPPSIRTEASMAGRYEEAITRAIMAMTFASGLPEVAAAYDFTEAIKGLAAALREQDAWWPIDDKEHPAPKDGTPFWGLIESDAITMFWHPKFGEFITSFRQMTMAPRLGGEVIDHSPEIVHPRLWRPRPAFPSPPPDTGRGQG